MGQAPPHPPGMTSVERSIVTDLHRVGEATSDRADRRSIMDGLDLLVDLIRARGHRLEHTEHWDRPHDD